MPASRDVSGSKAAPPGSLSRFSHRYVREDVALGLALLVCVADRAGCDVSSSVATHTTESLMVAASVPANDVAGLVRLARKKPGTKRSPLIPDVPTIAEAGFPELESMAWFGLVAPPHTPQTTVDRLAAEVGRVVAEPDFRQKYIANVGLVPVGSRPSEFGSFLARDCEKYPAQVRSAGIKPD